MSLTISVQNRVVVERRGVDVDVFQQYVVRMYDRHGPHLRLNKAHALDKGVIYSSPSDLVWAAGIVALSLDVEVSKATRRGE